MPQITARVTDQLVADLDAAARRLKRPRSEVVRQAIAAYLDDHEDLRVALERLQDPSDPVLDWEEVRRELVGTDQEQRR